MQALPAPGFGLFSFNKCLYLMSVLHTPHGLTCPKARILSWALCTEFIKTERTINGACCLYKREEEPQAVRAWLQGVFWIWEERIKTWKAVHKLLEIKLSATEPESLFQATGGTQLPDKCISDGTLWQVCFRATITGTCHHLEVGASVLNDELPFHINNKYQSSSRTRAFLKW